MQQDGVSPNGRTFVSALQACGMLAEKEEGAVLDGHSIRAKSLEAGKAIHANAQRRAYDSDVFVGNSLVSMYGKCGSLRDAQNAFCTMSHHDVVAWTAILAVNVEQGQWDKALLLYEQMQEDGVSPNDRTFVITLQACRMHAEEEEIAFVDGQSTKVKALGQGKAVHAYACGKGCDSDVFVASTLISMYGKCRSIVDAQNAFDRSTQCDIVSWNAILAVCVELGRAEKALQLYDDMWQEGMSPDARTLVTVVQACSTLAEDGKGRRDALLETEDGSDLDWKSSKMKCLEQAKALHAAAKLQCYDSDVFVGSSLVGLYGRCGSMVDAQNLFDGLSHRDVVLWNAILTMYLQQGEAGKALQLYQQLQLEGVDPTDRTFVSALQACGMLAEKEESVVVDGQSKKTVSLERGKAIHADVQRHGYEVDVYVGNTLVSMYGKCGSILDAQNVFDKLPQHDVVSWNAMLMACVEQGQAAQALQLYKAMREKNESPDSRTVVTVLQACGMLAEKKDDPSVDAQGNKLKPLEEGRAIHIEAKRRGYDSDVFVSSTLISMYGKCGSIEDAKNVFEGLCKRSVVSYNVMLVAYVQQGEGDKALRLYNQMQQEGVRPDEITLLCILQACSNTGGLTRLSQIHHAYLSTIDNLPPLLASTLIHAYGKCASMIDAQTVFDALPQPDVVSWTALMAGYARGGDTATTLQCYEMMQVAGVKPNGVTFLLLLSACSHAGLVEKGVDYFESMSRNHGITPEIHHYVSMLDLLGRTGCFERVEDMLSTLPVPPSLDLWVCVLGACQKHRQVVLGKQAFDSAVLLAPKRPAAYMLLWNIYADAGLWDLAKEVKQLRRTAGAWKDLPGQSWIEHEQEVYAFGVGDQKQPKQERLYGLLVSLDDGLNQQS